MPRASAAAAARTADDVLSCAAQMFGSSGYAAVSLDDVARQAGVTRGAVYHHYSSKAGLLAAVTGALQAQVASAVVVAAEAAGADPLEQLAAGCHAFVDAVTTGPAARTLLVDAPAVLGWEQWRRLDAENSVRHLRDALVAVGVAEELLDATTALLSGAMNEAALWVVQQPRRSGAREAAHRVLDGIVRGVVV